MMSPLAETLNRFGAWLVENLWHMSVELAILAGVVVAVIWLLRIQSPPLRHAFWCLVLAKPVATFLVASPISLYWFLRPPVIESVAPPPAPPAAVRTVRPPVGRPMMRYDMPRRIAAAEVVEPESFWRQLSWQGGVGLAWLGIALAFGVRLISGCAYVAFLRQTARLQRDGPLADLVGEVTQSLGLRRRVAVAVSDVAHGPVLAGVIKPVILLPRHIWDDLSTHQVRLIVAHELAHVRRFDNLFLLIQRLAEMFLFFHPAVWLCGWAMRREAESACDDAVLAVYGGSTQYADSLTRVAEMRDGLTRRLLVNTFAAAESNFSQRVRRILDGRVGRVTVRVAIGSIVALIIIGCVGLPTAAERKAKPQSKADKEPVMTETASEYGFRYDPMNFADNARSMDGVLVRTFVLERPTEGDRQLLRKHIDKLLADQRDDGSFGDTSKETGLRLRDLLELGLSPDRPEATRAADAILGQHRAGQHADEWYQETGLLGVYELHSLCLMGRTELPEVKASLEWLCGHPELYVGPDKGCPWTPAVFLKALWAGRHVIDTTPTVEHGLRQIASDLNAAGCLSYKDPWGLLECAGYIDLPIGREIVEKQVPLILRAQNPNGGWSMPRGWPANQSTFTVLRALVRHGLLDDLRERPALPADWKVVRSIPAPEGKLHSLTWDGQRLWVYDGSAHEALALSPEDGAVVRRVKVPAGHVRGMGWWDDALAVTQGNPWGDDPKRLLQVDATTGAIRREISFEDPKYWPIDEIHMGGVAQMGDRVWVVDSFFGQIHSLDPARPDERRYFHLSGPLPTAIAPQGDTVWHTDLWAPYIVRNAANGRLLDCGEKPFDGNVGGLAWDGRRLWALDTEQHRLCVIEKAPHAKFKAAVETGSQMTPKLADAGESAMAASESTGSIRTAAKTRREDGKVWIEGVAVQRGKNSVLAAMTSILQTAGEDVTYEYLMGVSSRAFRLQFNWCPSAPHSACGFNTFKPAMKAMGWAWTNYPTCNIGKQKVTAAEVAAARQAVEHSIDSGLPCTFGSEEEGVLVGYELATEEAPGLLRRTDRPTPYHAPVKKYPWGVTVFRKSSEPAPSRRESILWSLTTAVKNAHTEKFDPGYTSGFAAWERWIAELSGEKKVHWKAEQDDPGKIVRIDELNEDEKFIACLGNAWCYESLIDARRAAAKYLRSIVDEFSPEAGVHLTAAADHYEKVVYALKPAARHARKPWQFKGQENWTESMRQAQTTALKDALAFERQAVAEIQAALTAEGVDVSAALAAVDGSTPAEAGTSKATGPQKELKDYRWKPLWISQIGCLKAGLDYLGADVSPSWLFGATGYAFLLNVHDALCPSGWHVVEMPVGKMGQNAGYKLQPIVDVSADKKSKAERQKLTWDGVRKAIDAGLPCYGYDLEVGDYYTVHGYDDVGYYFAGPTCSGGKGPLAWRDYGVTGQVGIVHMCAIRAGKPADDRKTVTEALVWAVKHAQGATETHERYASGLAGYDQWIRALGSDQIEPHGTAYNAVCYLECRRNAVRFLTEAKQRLDDELNPLFDEAIGRYEAVAASLEQVAEAFPWPPDAEHIKDQARRRKATEALQAAKQAETQGVQVLAKLARALGADAELVAAAR